MILLFHCYGGAHTSITAANIHLGRLPRARRAALAEIVRQPFFDWMPPREVGRPLYMGADAQGRAVYCIGFGAGKGDLAAAVLAALRLMGGRTERLRLIDALPAATFLMRAGGFTSKVIGLRSVGRPLVAFGVWLNYRRFVQLAAQAAAPADRA